MQSYKLGGNFLTVWVTTCKTHGLCIIFYFYKQCQLMKCSCWHRQRFEWIFFGCLSVCVSVCESVCTSKACMYQIQRPVQGFLGVQTRSTTCAMTTNQPPAAPDCICYIPRKTEQNTVTPFVLVTLSMKNTLVPTSGGFRCKGWVSLMWFTTLCHLWLPSLTLLELHY